MTNAERTRWSLWAVNRAAAPVGTTLQIPELAGKRARASGSILAGPDRDASNYLEAARVQPRNHRFHLEFDRAGRAIVEFPGNAVLGIRLQPLATP
jgi:hypothetical protein